MTIWKNQQLTLILFGITVFFGSTILILCFLLCPILLSMVETKQPFDLKYIIIFICVLVILILLMGCACYIWIKRQRNKIHNEVSMFNNIDESDYEYCVEYNKQRNHFYPKNSKAKNEILFTGNVDGHYMSLCSVPVQPTSSSESKFKRSSRIETNMLVHSSASEGSSNAEKLDEKNQDVFDSMEPVLQNNVHQAGACASLQQSKQEDHRHAPELAHEDSFKGLPEFDPFDNYLHLVSIDTPLSPHTEFFPNNDESVNTQN